MPLVYRDMPTLPRDRWVAEIRKRQPGPADAALPPTHAQGIRQRCIVESVSAMMEYRLKFAKKFQALDAGQLFERLDFTAGGTLPGYVFEEIDREGILSKDTDDVFKIKNPIYEGRFAGAMYCLTQRRWPVLVLTGDPRPPGPDGWLRGWVPNRPNGHAMMGYKAAVRKVSGEFEFGIRCLNSRGTSWSTETKNTVIIPERELTGAIFYAFSTIVKE